VGKAKDFGDPVRIKEVINVDLSAHAGYQTTAVVGSVRSRS
jgi:hypothetical protein